MSKIIKIKKRSFMKRFYAINLFGIIITCLVLKYRNWMKAYYNIRFEKEAYAHQNDMEYLIRRKHYCYLTRIETRHIYVYTNLKVYHFLIKKCTTSKHLQRYS